ncbi:MAG TPA: TRAP transporter small permease [Burkholderiales bacterium]|nr:TRAP transporter small permease [Burkholderiales bacterium]
MKAAYSRVLDAVDRLARWAIVVASAAMIAIVALQVVLRYGFNASIDWSEEISRLLFVWTMFLAIPLGIREGAHVGIELLVAHIAPQVRAALAKGCAIGGAAIMAVVFWQAVKVAALTWDEMMQSVNFSANWFMVPVAIAAAHSFFHFVQLLWREPRRTVVAIE